ncbi:nucleoside hydrolase [Marinivivus vitaminiproducens]|uniref:nucleoside hydrolase n=1 Tax=Marinivivus vitaminiproducens TaxID=3035935 RepID=UPI00279B252D|nr:nucleoside hydrolase [Geminicoccaceae bacterium SCSIO 64248]
MTARPILLDCDPGQDDALAIFLALASPAELDVVAITTVGGNVKLRHTEVNARKLCTLAGRADIPVHAGCPGPILKPLVTAEHIHGPTGLEGADLPEPAQALQAQHAVDRIVDEVMARPSGELTLVATGPLTNLALAMVKAPEIAPRLREIVLMGGGRLEGNVTPAAEFNIWVDPHAAAVVFNSGVPIVMFGLDVTHKALVTPERLAAIAALGTPVAKAAAGLLDFFNRFDSDRYGTPGAPLHDPCTIAYLLDPGLFGGRHCHVAIETAGQETLGTTVIDWWNALGREPNALVMVDIDADRFFDLLTGRIARL